jgi:hypothetical protein
MGSQEGALLRRVLGKAGDAGLLPALADRLSGTDLTSLLLEVMRRRTERISVADVMRQYLADRFVSPAPVDFRALRRVEDVMLAALEDDFEVLTLAPLMPLATHFAVAAVDPRNVVATIRRTEVAADPTNGLALEAAVRRRRLLDADARSAQAVRLAAIQRVTRAQHFEGPVSFAHFELFAAVTSGRDTGDYAFERQHLIEHLRFAVRGLVATGASEIKIALTRLPEAGGVAGAASAASAAAAAGTASAAVAAGAAGAGGAAGAAGAGGAAAEVLADVENVFADVPAVCVADAPERERGRAYYRFLCFKIYAGFPGSSELTEISDGGFTDWTARLLGNRKERLLISGHGLDRLAILSQPQTARGGGALLS